MMQQFFTGTHDLGHLVVECHTKAMLSNDNSYDLTACYLLKQQRPSKSLLNALLTFLKIDGNPVPV
jgi:hypothetical protein